MGNKNSKKINQQSENEYGRINQEADKFNNYTYGRLPEAQKHGSDIWNKNYGTFNDILGGTYAGRSGGAGGGGNLGGYADYFKNFGGGVDAAGQNRIRGNGVFDEYSKTGGFNEADKSNFLQQATGAVPRFYDAIQNEMSRMKGVQGGYSPGYDAQMSKISRDKTQAGQSAILDAQTNLHGMIDKNRQWGTEGMSGSELSLQNLMSRNKLNSMGQAANLSNMQDANDRAWTFGATSGLNDLYGTAPGEEGMLLNNINDSRQIRGGQIGNNLGQRMQYNPNKGFMDHLKDFAGIAAPIAMSAFGAPGGGSAMSNPSAGYQRGNFDNFTQGNQIVNPFKRNTGGYGGSQIFGRR